MKDLDDLRRELRSRAAEPRGTPMPDRLAGVQSKVVAARRRKAAASSAAALASLAVIGVAWAQVFNPLGNDDVADAELAPLPTELNGDELVTARYNESGSSELSWVDRLDDLNVVAQATCQLPSHVALPEPDVPVMLAWGFGNQLYTMQCGQSGEASVGSLGPTTRAEWRDIGVRPDQPFEIEVWLHQSGSGRIEVPQARFGLGIYDKTGGRERSDGVELLETIDVDGETYRLDRWETHPLSEGPRQVRLKTPRSDQPAVVVYGWQADIPSAGYDLTQDGEPLTSGYGGSLEGPLAVDSGERHTLALEAAGSSDDGVLVLAYYVLEE